MIVLALVLPFALRRLRGVLATLIVRALGELP